MIRSKSKELDSILNQFLRESGLETPLNQYRLIEAWYKLKDNSLKAYTEQAYIYNQKLYVKLNTPALKANLMMQRQDLTRELNGIVKANVIIDIVFL
ncbi:MAG: DUF721 domain-containing protein [Bacteroidaceae bacterium]|nr:DUF721 domain-containing protein [Bacteroidaceae bacterium]